MVWRTPKRSHPCPRTEKESWASCWWKRLLEIDPMLLGSVLVNTEISVADIIEVWIRQEIWLTSLHQIDPSTSQTTCSAYQDGSLLWLQQDKLKSWILLTVAHKIILHFTLHSFKYSLLKLYVYYSQIEQSLTL